MADKCRYCDVPYVTRMGGVWNDVELTNCPKCGHPAPPQSNQPGKYSMFSDRNGNTLSVKDMKKVGENP